jgi:hypothetical protein
MKIGPRGTDFFFFKFGLTELILGLCPMAIFGFMVLNLRSLLVYLLLCFRSQVLWTVH